MIILRRDVNMPMSHFLRPRSQSRDIELWVMSSNNIGGTIHTDWYNPPLRRKRSDSNNNTSLRPRLFLQCTALLYIATKTTIVMPQTTSNLHMHSHLQQITNAPVLILRHVMGGKIIMFKVALWRNGSASDSRSEGCVFKSRQGHSPLTTNLNRDIVYCLGIEMFTEWLGLIQL